MCGEFLDFLPAPLGRPIDIVRARLKIHGGYTDFGETKLIGPIEIAAVCKLIRLDRSALLRCILDHEFVDRSLAKSNINDVFGRTMQITAVVVQVCSDFAWADRRVGGIPF